ncbi:MAG: hypothetical protein O4965_05770, partial [Trichodesmium sp. St19_bin1]|nr:hypothetical protein [Trichodesmium sp. St19_bin1]
MLQKQYNIALAPFQEGMVFLSCSDPKTHAKMNLNSSCFETQVSDKTKFSALSVFLKLFSHRYSSITKSDKWTTVKHVLTDGLL